ncbi:MAG: hypothetical protein ACJA2P_002447 [Rhodoferax sp.]|jgi:hypothetical protein
MRQVRHLDRALRQIIGLNCAQGALCCPEVYYLEQRRYAPNDQVPLLWMQDNLWLAFQAMQQNVLKPPAV